MWVTAKNLDKYLPSKFRSISQSVIIFTLKGQFIQLCEARSGKNWQIPFFKTIARDKVQKSQNIFQHL